jgi:hypothetical protein
MASLLLAGIAAPALARATATSCQRILMQAPPESKVNAIIESLARLKLELDLSKVKGQFDSQDGLLNQQYEIKKTELLAVTGMSKESLNQKLREYITVLQKTKNEEIKKEKVVREVQAPKELYKLKSSKEVRNLGIAGSSAFLTKDHKRIVNYISIYYTVISTVTGEILGKVSLNQGGLHIPKQDLFLLKDSDQYYFFDPNTLNREKVELELRTVSQAYRHVKSALAPDQNTILFYNSDGYNLYDFALKKVTLSGNFSKIEFSQSYKIELLPDNSFLIFTRSKISKFDPIANKETELSENPNNYAQNAFIHNNSEAIIITENGLVIYNLKNKTVSTYESGSLVADILPGPSPEKIWLLFLNQESQLFNTTTLRLEGQSPFSLNEDINRYYKYEDALPYVLIYESNWETNVKGLKVHSRTNLEELSFNFDNRYQGDIAIEANTISEDGSVIVNITRSKSTEEFFLETWEKSK